MVRLKFLTDKNSRLAEIDRIGKINMTQTLNLACEKVKTLLDKKKLPVTRSFLFSLIVFRRPLFDVKIEIVC